MRTISLASNYDDLKHYADELSSSFQLSQKILQKLLPLAMKGNYERYLSDANLFMEYMNIVVLRWLWLEMALPSKEKIAKGDLKYYNIHTN